MSDKRLDFITNGTSSVGPLRWRGGRGSFMVSGTFGGATVTLRMLLTDGATWVGVVSITAAGIQNFELPRGQLDVAVIGGSPSGLYATAVDFRP